MTQKRDQDLDHIIAEVTSGADDDAAAMAAFHEAIADKLKVPTFGIALGERVQIDAVEYTNIRRGIVARLRKDGRTQRVGLLDVIVPGKSKGAMLVAAYQRWAGVATNGDTRPTTPAVGPMQGAMNAAVLKVGDQTARIRPLGEDQEITLRGSGGDLWAIVPGQIVAVTPNKRWTHRGYEYMSGRIEGARVDAAALGLRPLAVREKRPIELGEPYGHEFDQLWQAVSSHRNVAFELEHVVPGAEERDVPALAEAMDLHSDRIFDRAEAILAGLLHADLRCLDAHSLLGRWSYEAQDNFLAAKALPHFEVGVAIGELALGPHFAGRLPLKLRGNVSFLGCLHGYGLALWRFGRPKEAERVFERLCVLNPADEARARDCWKAVRDGLAWGTMPPSP